MRQVQTLLDDRARHPCAEPDLRLRRVRVYRANLRFHEYVGMPCVAETFCEPFPGVGSLLLALQGQSVFMYHAARQITH